MQLDDKACRGLWEFPKKGGQKMSKLTPLRAIRKKCLDCCGGQLKEVRVCNVKTCALYAFRSGHMPKGEEDTIKDVRVEKM